MVHPVQEKDKMEARRDGEEGQKKLKEEEIKKALKKMKNKKAVDINRIPIKA